jgi:hypothetical protein
MSTRTWCVAALLIVSVPAASQTVLSEAERHRASHRRQPAGAGDLAPARRGARRGAAAGRYPNPRLSVDREAVAGVSETLTTVLQPLPITGRRTLERRRRAAVADATAGARTTTSGGFAPTCGWPMRSWPRRRSVKRELTRSRASSSSSRAFLERREAAGDAAGFDRLRAEREVLDAEADLVIAAADRARGAGAPCRASAPRHRSVDARGRAICRRRPRLPPSMR